MLKKLFVILYLFFVVLFQNLFQFIGNTYAEAPHVNCYGLPGCVDGAKATPSDATISYNIGAEVVGSVIGQAIQFVAVVAVIALILSGILYLLSNGDEEKTKKAKTWIIWSLVGVFLSISAWGIINMLNNINIG